MKKHFFIYFLVFILVFSFPVNAAQNTDGPTYSTPSDATATATDSITNDTSPLPADAPEIASPSAIVMDINTGTILYQKDAYSANYPASITKVLTALVTLENADLSDTVTLSENAVWGIERDSSHIGLDVGEQITLEDAMYGMLLESANEASIAIAEYVGGSVENFSNMMNEKADELGCVNSHFVNPNGLHDENHYTCAYDMALIGCAAYKNAEFRKIAGSITYTIPATNKAEARELWHNDGMLFSTSKYYYEYCTAGKTGYTTDANGTLISFAEKDDMQLVCVTLNAVPSANTFYDTVTLFDFCFDNYTKVTPLTGFSFENIEINSDYNTSAILNNYYNNVDSNMLNLSVNNYAEIIIRTNISTDDITWSIDYYDEPEGNTLGRMVFYYNNEEIGSTPVYYDGQILAAMSDSVAGDKSSDSGFKFRLIYLIPVFILVIMVLLLIRIRIVRTKRRKYRENRRFRYYRY